MGRPYLPPREGDSAQGAPGKGQAGDRRISCGWGQSSNYNYLGDGRKSEWRGVCVVCTRRRGTTGPIPGASFLGSLGPGNPNESLARLPSKSWGHGGPGQAAHTKPAWAYLAPLSALPRASSPSAAHPPSLCPSAPLGKALGLRLQPALSACLGTPQGWSLVIPGCPVPSRRTDRPPSPPCWPAPASGWSSHSGEARSGH